MRIVVRRLGYAVVGVVAVGVRWAFVDFQSGDFVAFVSRSWTYIDRRTPYWLSERPLARPIGPEGR